MKRLTKEDLLFIFAVKDRREHEYYERHYGKYHDEPTVDTLVSIGSDVVDKINAWDKVFQQIRMNKMLMRMSKAHNHIKETGEIVKPLGVEPTLEEWLWFGISWFFKYITTDWLNENAPKNWKKLVESERLLFNKKMGIINKFFYGNVVRFQNRIYFIREVFYFTKQGLCLTDENLRKYGCAYYTYALDEIRNHGKYFLYDRNEADKYEDIILDVEERELMLVADSVDSYLKYD